FPAGDVVTLDKVICCYDDMNALVNRSAERAGRLYGAVFPRDNLGVRALIAVLNGARAFGRSGFRSYIHRSDDIARVLARHGFGQRATATTAFWRVVVFERRAPARAGWSH